MITITRNFHKHNNNLLLLGLGAMYVGVKCVAKYASNETKRELIDISQRSGERVEVGYDDDGNKYYYES